MYQVEFLREATDVLLPFDKPVAQRLLKKLRWAAENFEFIEPEALTGPLREFSKLRPGDYRIIYRADRQNKRS